jgi:hypothetical protein
LIANAEGPQPITTSETVINYSTIVGGSGDVLLASGVFTILKSGAYEGRATVRINKSGNPDLFIWIEYNTGNGWALYPLTLAHFSFSNDNTSTFQLNSGLILSEGDMFRIKVKRVGGGTTSLEGVNLTTALGPITQPASTISFRKIKN